MYFIMTQNQINILNFEMTDFVMTCQNIDPAILWNVSL